MNERGIAAQDLGEVSAEQSGAGRRRVEDDDALWMELVSHGKVVYWVVTG
jgi:hypothetical protein